MHFLQEILEPENFGASTGKTTIFSLRTRAGDHSLFLGALGDEIATHEKIKPRGRPAIIWATSPIGVGISMNISGRAIVKGETVMQSTKKIAKKALHSSPVSCRGRMHVLRVFIDRKGNIGPSQCGILKDPDNAAVIVRIIIRSTVFFGENDTSGNRSRSSFSTEQICLGEKIKNVLGLREMNANIGVGDSNAENIMKLAQILKSKLSVEVSNTRGNSGGITAGDENVIDID